MDEEEKPVRRLSSIVLIIIVVVLALSASALYQAIDLYLKQDVASGYYLLIGFLGLAFSIYMLLQTRRRMRRFALKTTPVTTTITCQKCDFKNLREFERGDFILKEAGSCTKCDGTLLISAIYRELKEKVKEERF
ncbi:hypothetical protein KAH85_03880 [Candidatus Bathyarchaeota archaeon]|nr:hypothetical protein [Candidatus Bathyarchaeota archaeon]